MPVENEEGGLGSQDSHWRLAVFTNELMTSICYQRGRTPSAGSPLPPSGTWGTT